MKKLGLDDWETLIALEQDNAAYLERIAKALETIAKCMLLE